MSVRKQPTQASEEIEVRPLRTDQLVDHEIHFVLAQRSLARRSPLVDRYAVAHTLKPRGKRDWLDDDDRAIRLERSDDQGNDRTQIDVMQHQIAHREVELIRPQWRSRDVPLDEMDPVGNAVDLGPLPRDVDQLGADIHRRDARAEPGQNDAHRPVAAPEIEDFCVPDVLQVREQELGRKQSPVSGLPVPLDDMAGRRMDAAYPGCTVRLKGELGLESIVSIHLNSLLVAEGSAGHLLRPPSSPTQTNRLRPGSTWETTRTRGMRPTCRGSARPRARPTGPASVPPWS